ncbi:MAG: cytochrome c nitrite reductase small subunit [Bacteroidetes bacterium]|nr:MAG: cytochrome c nitrite reductase small subunit [Bacteroidota bacterium]
MRLKEYVNKLFPSRRAQIGGIVVAGIFCGLVVYLGYASNGASYLSDNPKTCVNCHIMGPYYATWQHSSHARNATCNDCHVPHDSFFKKWFFKGKDGLRHASVFALRREPQVIQAIDASAEVIMANCIRCHSQLNQEFVNTGRIAFSDVTCGKGKACWDCHREVPHRGSNSLSSTPNAIVPYPKGLAPDWLKEITRN